MKVLALDQSTTATGCALFTGNTLTDYMLIKPKVSKKVSGIMIEKEPHLYSIKMPEELYGTTLCRTTAIADQIELIIKDFKPDVIYFEEIFENKNPKFRNPKGYRSLARLQGFICHICHQHNIRYIIVEENKWINSFGSYGSDFERDDRKADLMKKITKV